MMRFAEMPASRAASRFRPLRTSGARAASAPARPQDQRNDDHVEVQVRNPEQLVIAHLDEHAEERPALLMVLGDVELDRAEHLAHAEGGDQRVDPQLHNDEAGDGTDQGGGSDDQGGNDTDRQPGVQRHPVHQHDRQRHHLADRQVVSVGRERHQERQAEDCRHRALREDHLEGADGQEEMELQHTEQAEEDDPEVDGAEPLQAG